MSPDTTDPQGPSNDIVATLAHGEVFGRRERREDVGGFAVASLSADPTREIGLHTHETAHFVFVTSGTYITDAFGAQDDSAHTALIYNPPGTMHRDRFARSGGTVAGTFLTIGIDAACIADAEAHERLPDHPTRVPGVMPRSLAIRIGRTLGDMRQGGIDDIEEMCLELVGESARPSTHGDHAPAWLARAREVLRDQVARNISVREVAREAGAHPVHLARAFRRFFGCSPSDYVRRCRAEHAARLLERTMMPLSMVAVESGYADQSHMTKAFQRDYRVTPAAYRRGLAAVVPRTSRI